MARCHWKINETKFELEAGCDDANKQLIIGTISITRPSVVPLAPMENCQTATQGFIKSVCTAQGATVTHQNDTTARCIIQHWDKEVYMTQVDEQVCDTLGKHSMYNVTVLSTMPYGAGRNCDQAVLAWKNGQESARK